MFLCFMLYEFMVEVIPGILEQDFSTIVDKIRKVEEYVDWIQIDILDGTLFGNNNFHDSIPFKNLRTRAKLELHMMVINPDQLIDEWAAVGFNRFIGHVEGITNVERFITTVRSKKKEVGLALDIDTDISIIEPFIPNIDVVLIMTIHTGRSGQPFQEKAIMKIHKLRAIAPDLPIEVDGHIDLTTGRQVREAGATRLASTSYIFKSPNIPAAIKSLQNV